MESKNAAAYGCANTRKPAQVKTPPIQRYQPHPQGILYDISPSFVKGGLAAFVRGSIFVGWKAEFTLCRLTLSSVFVFSGSPGSASSPGTARFMQKGRTC